jgi:hypothetical protein
VHETFEQVVERRRLEARRTRAIARIAAGVVVAQLVGFWWFLDWIDDTGSGPAAPPRAERASASDGLGVGVPVSETPAQTPATRGFGDGVAGLILDTGSGPA